MQMAAKGKPAAPKKMQTSAKKGQPPIAGTTGKATKSTPPGFLAKKASPKKGK
jgi:hypothetical protein